MGSRVRDIVNLRRRIHEAIALLVTEKMLKSTLEMKRRFNFIAKNGARQSEPR